MNTPEQQQSTTMLNVKESDKQGFFENEEIEGTPFRLITTENGSFAVMGKQRITETMETKEEVLGELSLNTPWRAIVNTIAAVVEEINNQKNTK